MTSGKAIERLFRKNAKKAGLRVEESKSIRCEIPVANKRGDLVKTVTLPDCYIVDPKTGRAMYVELGNGLGEGGHKQAQKRVAEAAGVENYIQLTGEDVKYVDAQPTVKKKRSAIFALLGWILML